MLMPWRTSCIGKATPVPVSMVTAPRETERRPSASSDQENAILVATAVSSNINLLDTLVTFLHENGYS